MVRYQVGGKTGNVEEGQEFGELLQDLNLLLSGPCGATFISSPYYLGSRGMR